jgi:hypothetical protein
VKSAGIIALMLFAATSTVYSQVFRLDVEDMPLNRVLNLLDVEISFDDKALSAYNVSASKSFKNREEALSWLLKSKPFHIERMGSVYIIVPADRRDAGITFSHAEKEEFIFEGTVIDRETLEPLEYATVSLIDADGKPVTTGVTANTGKFLMKTARIPGKIKISYLGYETLLNNLHSLNRELGVFPLQVTAIPLEETVVTGDNAHEKINITSYVVTPQMCNGATNALELIDRIPGEYFEQLTDAVRDNQHSNILLLVDGIQHSSAYLKHLSPHRVHAVEVIHAPSGRFVSDDYAAIIRFILKKDYTGYDMHVSNTASLNLSKTTAYSRWTENRPAGGMTYTTRKLNLFATYSYNREQWNMYSSKELLYNKSELVSIPAERPNSLNEYEGNTLTGGVNYQITPRQLVSVQGDYTSGNTYTLQTYTMRREDLTQNNNPILVNTTENLTKDNMFTGTLFYQGQPGNRLHLYGDFSYNYYYNIIENEYSQNAAANYLSGNIYDEYKNHTVFNLEGKYLLSDRMSAELGYSNTWRRYASESSIGQGFLNYREYRNKSYVYLSYNPSGKIGLKSGFALEHIKTQNREVTDSYLRVLPYFQLGYRMNPTANIHAGYAVNQSYPSLYQLSPMNTVIDTFLTQIGNPALKSAVRHHAFVELSLWDRLRIIPQFNFIRDGISEVYDRQAYKLYRTFDNIHTREYSVQATYDQTFGADFRLKNAMTFYYAEARHDGISNSLNGWTLQSTVNYYHSPASVGVQLGYYRNMRKDIVWQGYQMSGKDYWRVSVQKELWRNRISVMLSYIPPVTLGVRYDRTREMDTQLYKEKTTLHLDAYSQMLLLKVNIRFERGSSKPVEKRTVIRKDEREKQTVGFQ